MGTGPLVIGGSVTQDSPRRGLSARFERRPSEAAQPAALAPEHEAKLKDLAAEMVAEWQAEAWGPASAANMARFCKWLAAELESPGQASPPAFPPV